MRVVWVIKPNLKKKISAMQTNYVTLTKVRPVEGKKM